MMTAAGADAPRELRRKVTSPNGTTQAAIEHMERAGLPTIVADAMAAAVVRRVARTRRVDDAAPPTGAPGLHPGPLRDRRGWGNGLNGARPFP